MTGTSRIVIKRHYRDGRIKQIEVYLDDQKVALVTCPEPIIDHLTWTAYGYKRFPAGGTAVGYGEFATRRAALRAAVAWATQLMYAEMTG